MHGQVRILMRHPSDASFVLLKAHSSMTSGSLRHSVGLYHHALRLRPDLPLTHLCLAVNYLLAVFQKWTGGQRHRPVLLTFACLGNYRAIRLGESTTASVTMDADVKADDVDTQSGYADDASDNDDDGDDDDEDYSECACVVLCCDDIHMEP